MAKKKNTKKTTGKKKSANTSIKKKTSSVKKTTTTKKKTSTTTKKTSSTKTKVSVPKIVESDIKTEEIVLPKLKTREVSKNKNIPSKVVSSEDFTKSSDKKTTVKKNNKTTIKKSNDKKIAKRKKNNFKKNLDKYIRKIRMYGLTSVVDKKYIIGGIGILVLLIILPIIFAFGGKSRLDLSVVPSKIDTLTYLSFESNDAIEIINADKNYELFDKGLQMIDGYDFKDKLNMETYYVSDYSFNYNKSKKQLFFAVKAIGDYDQNVVSGIKKFFKDNKIDEKDVTSFEYQGYNIYIKSKSKDKDTIVSSKVRQSNKRVFNILKELKKDEIEKTYGISGSYYSEALVKVAMVVKSDTCEYAIFKPVNDNAKIKIKNAMDEYYKGLETKWNNNEENLNLVKNRYFEEYQGYLIYIVSHDNDMIMELIKKS